MFFYDLLLRSFFYQEPASPEPPTEPKADPGICSHIKCFRLFYMGYSLVWSANMSNYVARQPIFNRSQEVIAYELLHRSGPENYYTSLNGDLATAEVISNSFLLIGMDTLTRGKKAYINFTRALLEKKVPTLLPKESTVIEILEDVEPDDKIINIFKELKELGYVLALDDFSSYTERYRELVGIVDIIKVDF